ncbi:TetR/AcrR family transcriptional regulator [Paraburkholderia pallida]|uniref:TetR/AcrR family transcriptional regulator n=1 Tax=Paraburkholderia pallida TaxID=2547399 RepID=A0A4P7D4M1_9BURK|nr:TetR/AcrR family transcriptional regulator [Paraburkholderia pallida]QBR01542.1 TetR/AcrR family transcriptional regulator [Paraburkholderia pallida]
MATVNLERRSEIGQQRRERTRQRLIDAAAELFAKDGFDAVTTDHIIAAAQVARGTFYNHFDTKEALLLAMGRDFFDGYEAAILEATREVDDPLERIAIRVRTMYQRAVDSPLYGWLMVRLLPLGPVGTRNRQHLEADLLATRERGDATFASLQVAVDLVQGPLTICVRNALLGGHGYPIDELIASILRGIGAAPERAVRVATGR